MDKEQLLNIPVRIISLPVRTDRRAQQSENFLMKGFFFNNLKTVSAIEDREFGGLGCAKSHMLALAEAIAVEKNEYIVIFEDDFDFQIDLKHLREILARLNEIDSQWDVFLFTGTETIVSAIFEKTIAKVFESQTTAGYLIRRNYAKKLINLYLKSIEMMEAYFSLNQRELIYNRFAIDQSWKQLQRADRWYCAVPQCGFQRPSYSDIEKKHVQYHK